MKTITKTILGAVASIALVLVGVGIGVWALRGCAGTDVPPDKGDKQEDNGGTDVPPDKGGKQEDNGGADDTPVTEDTAPVPQLGYTPINEPQKLQMLRKKGKTYESAVVGKLSGTATASNWGIKGQANFVYTYSVQSTGKIVENNGIKVIEERTFSKVSEQLFYSEGMIKFDLPPAFVWAAEIAWSLVDPSSATVVSETLREGKLDIKLLKMFGLDDLATSVLVTEKLDAGKLLQGKKVRIEFTDGQGITNITPIGCKLTQDERDVINRTNFVMDHYIMPDREVRVNESWTVDASVFAGLLDPRMKGRVRGNVTIDRKDDLPLEDKVARRLRLTDGTIEFVSNSTDEYVNGCVKQVRGTCQIPSDVEVVTEANITGIAEYKSVSKDHLLFKATMSTAPRFEVKYECRVKD
ncbi:MAG: hypothetical protein PUC53_03045 [Bacteroidales bacterium]|nr:hypothetical protein [Bacteroidales bacterium]